MNKILTTILSFFSLLATQLASANPPLTEEKKAILTQEEAIKRSKQISEVDYKMYFRLPEKDPLYYGKVEIAFAVSSNASSFSDQIFLDYASQGGKDEANGTLVSISLNGKSLEKDAQYSYKNSKIFIKSSAFQVGKNILIIEFKNPYRNSGFGFHRTKDSKDSQYYMYSNFEPYHANHAFPNFDQPDLKATYTLTVDAPIHWQVIANTLETQAPATVEIENSKWNRWEFPKTKKFSTYLFALIAGPYDKWESRTDNGVPLRLFARKSLSEYLSKDAEHWFNVTKRGFQFFEKSFKYEYPFTKYDQILTPDYNHGAMENVGAVTFTESYIFRSPPTPLEVLRRAETIIHELAHMWFGNLVTMKWWDDLWLNESFATFISNPALSKFWHEFGPAHVWQQFNARNKAMAYIEDDYVTTHPIVATAADTDEARANFDGITYAKGASVLKQLMYFMSEEKFFTGLQNYFRKFAFQNTTRSDFMQSLSEAFGKDLTAWDQEWLKTSGTNSVQVSLEQENGKVTKLVLRQFPDEADHKLRTHQTVLGLYDWVNDELVLREKLSVTYSGEETVISEVIGKAIPGFIFPNTEDYDFVHVTLDQRSLTSLKTSLSKVSDPLLRQMLWSTLWNMVRHAKLPAQEFAEIALEQLKNEKSLAVLQRGIDTLQASLWYLDQKLRTSYLYKIENFVNRRLLSIEPGDPIKIMLFNKFVGSARSKEAVTTLRQWLSQEGPIMPEFTLDQERRWSIITRLAASGATDATQLIDQELTKDKNDKGVIAGMVADAIIPDEANKTKWWNRILGEDQAFPKLSIERVRKVMSVFHDPDHPELTRFTNHQFFDLIPALSSREPGEFSASFANAIYPLECTPELIQQTTGFLDKNPALEIGVKKEILQKRQLTERTIAARRLSAEKAEP